MSGLPRIGRMKRTRSIAVLIALLLAIASAAWWFMRDRDGGITYRTAKVERGSLQAAVSASGTVNPVTQVQVSSQVSGQIKELFVDFNSEVKQGQLIARLDPETFEYRVRQASADVEAARASVLTAQANVQQALAQLSRAQVEQVEAQRDLERKQGLVAQNFISPAELDVARAKVATLAESTKAAQAQVAVARAQAQNAAAIVAQRQAQMSQARVDLERTQIRSPVDGVVIKRSVEVGQTVAASLQAPELFVIARNLNDMQVEASIDETDISRVRLQHAVSFTIDAFPGRTFEGTVGQMRKAAVASQNVVTYIVVVAFANPASTVLPGMTANVRIITDTRESALKVPNAALRVRVAGIEPEPAASAARSGSTSGALWPATAMAQGAAKSDVANAALPGATADGPSAAPARPASSTARGQGGGPLREMRDRLVVDLQLTPAQVQAVDALIAATMPGFAELRSMPEEERPKARERKIADLRARIAEQLTPEQKAKYQRQLADAGGRQTTRGRIYLLGEDGKPRAYAVRLGISDGVMTELLVTPNTPEAQVLTEGANVITAVVGPGTATGARPAGLPRAPF
jgi:HlyD family secretion protein